MVFSLKLFWFFLGLLVIGSEKKLQIKSNEPTLITWNEFYRLQWFDFKGQPDSASFADAGTAVRIEAKPYIVKRRINYDVNAFFIPGKSWVKDPSPDLLAHERLHFDIAELYARKIRARIKELQQQKERDLKIYNRAVKKLLEESNQLDLQYDIETLHGGLKKQQKQWEAHVQKELIALQAFRKNRPEAEGNLK